MRISDWSSDVCSSDLPARKTPAAPDYSEGLNTAGKRAQQSDALAQVPAIAAAWKMPERGSEDQAPMAVLGALLAEGDASRLYLGMVKGRELALNVDSLYGLTSAGERWEERRVGNEGVRAGRYRG